MESVLFYPSYTSVLKGNYYVRLTFCMFLYFQFASLLLLTAAQMLKKQDSAVSLAIRKIDLFKIKSQLSRIQRGTSLLPGNPSQAQPVT